MKNFLPRRARRGENASACETAQNRFRLFHAVHGGGEDAAGVARALAAGIEAARAATAGRLRRARMRTGEDERVSTPVSDRVAGMA